MRDRPTPETTAARRMSHCKHLPRYVVDVEVAEKLERQRDAALDREAALMRFCEAEMGWEFFRHEFQITDNPSKTYTNAIKLHKYLAQNRAAIAAATTTNTQES